MRMRKRLRFGMGKASAISGILGAVGYFVISDLSKENSVIKTLINKLPFFKRKQISDKKGKYYIVDDVSEKIEK
ncbi:MAG TPA: hypothetical protein PLG34_00180 [Spirochaetota bacterium]|jgi:hypothetical protein|nr:MAG: hypothetical protein BWX91_00347 [Spirochaetes bacterium ADurb.Bin133]HPY86384.1 hypothetical protein [Spirochaetota bacterium]HQB61846.1 hypothetical protein [Spirochaetota bacterium]